MEKLKPMDEVAYVRFASVYRQFKDIDSFKRELDKFWKNDKQSPLTGGVFLRRIGVRFSHGYRG